MTSKTDSTIFLGLVCLMLVLLPLVKYASPAQAGNPAKPQRVELAAADFIDIEKAVLEKSNVHAPGSVTLLNNGLLIIETSQTTVDGIKAPQLAVLQLPAARPTSEQLYALLTWEGDFDVTWDKGLDTAQIGVWMTDGRQIDLEASPVTPGLMTGPSCSVDCTDGKCDITCPEGKAALCFCKATTATCTCTAIPK